jgi:hypothetical protein
MIIKGLYVLENYPYPDFKELENRGLSHVFYVDSFLLNDYTKCKTNLRGLITEMEGTNLELHVCENAFRAADRSTLVDPTNMAHRNLLQTALIQLLGDMPEIGGISLEDFDWQNWSGYDANQRSVILAGFAKQIATAVHEFDDSKKISASVNWTSPNLTLTSAELDFIMLKIYQTNSSDVPLSIAIKTVQKEIKDTPLAVVLVTYDSAVTLTPKNVSDVYNDISTVIDVVGVNYSLYAWPRIPYGLGFPSENYSYTQVFMELNLASKHKTIPKKSNRTVTVNFLDQNNNPLSEDVLSTIVGEYKITDQSSGRVIKDFTNFIPDNSIYELNITGDDNRIINSNVSQENHIITVSIVYGDGKIENEELTVTVLNLSGIK